VTNADIDIFELHDAYTIISSLNLEAAGFAERGRGVHFGKEGEIALGGRLAMSTFGGLKSRGHPVGANQVPNHPETALVQNIGGTGATVVSRVL
jgi:acetyl-CoA C-acetyltransferase